MNKVPLVILLADDDEDDCLLFREVLNELSINSKFHTVPSGDELMKYLNETKELPDVLFLDLNMPTLNGQDCLKAIRRQDSLNNLIVIIYSTSYDIDVAIRLQEIGADFYIRKPPEFTALKSVIHRALLLIKNEKGISSRHVAEHYILNEE